MQTEQAHKNNTAENIKNEAEAIVLTDDGMRLAAFWSRILSGCGFDGNFNPLHVMENVIPIIDKSFNYCVIEKETWIYGELLPAFYSPNENTIFLRSDIYSKALANDAFSLITVTHEVTHSIQSIIMRFLRSLECIELKTEFCKNNSPEMRRHEHQTDRLMNLVLSPESLLKNKSDEDIAMEYLVKPLMGFMCSVIKYSGKMLLEVLNEIQIQKSA